MPISGIVLAPGVVGAAGSTDPVGIASWTAVSVVVGTWLLTGVPSPLSDVPLVAVAAKVEGEGKIVYADAGASLGPLLAAASASLDAMGVARWLAVGLALGAWMNANAYIDPTNLVAVPGVNPAALQGSGGVAFKRTNLGVLLAGAAGSTDTEGVRRWTAIGNAIIAHMESAGVVNVGTMQSPGPGGPVTGVGALA